MTSSMNLLTFGVLAILAFHVGTLSGKPADEPKHPVVRSMGHFAKRHPITGEHHRLHGHGLQGLGKEENHHLRVNFDDDQMPPMSLQVSHRSVWTKNSVIVERRGNRKVDVTNDMNTDCLLHGILTDAEGTVSINTCGKSVIVDIHTPEHHYHLEEHKTHEYEGEASPSHGTFEVAKTRHERSAFEEKYHQEAVDLVQRKAEEILEKEPADNNGTLRTKRYAPQITVEVAVFLNKDFVDNLRSARNIDTTPMIHSWITSKWNTVQSVYGDPAKVGAQLTIALKHIDVWYTNPEGYPGNDKTISEHLDWFCQHTPDTDDYDMKVLYVRGGEGHAMGLAYRNGICTQHRNCNLVRASDDHVRYEVHEMGHSLGFEHDPSIANCNGDGFMGWSDTYKFLNCYKRVLRRRLQRNKLPCLFVENIPENSNDPETTPYYY